MRPHLRFCRVRGDFSVDLSPKKANSALPEYDDLKSLLLYLFTITFSSLSKRDHPGIFIPRLGRRMTSLQALRAQSSVLLAACQEHLGWLMIEISPQDNSKLTTGLKRVEI